MKFTKTKSAFCASTLAMALLLSGCAEKTNSGSENGNKPNNASTSSADTDSNSSSTMIDDFKVLSNWTDPGSARLIIDFESMGITLNGDMSVRNDSKSGLVAIDVADFSFRVPAELTNSEPVEFSFSDCKLILDQNAGKCYVPTDLVFNVMGMSKPDFNKEDAKNAFEAQYGKDIKYITTDISDASNAGGSLISGSANINLPEGLDQDELTDWLKNTFAPVAKPYFENSWKSFLKSENGAHKAYINNENLNGFMTTCKEFALTTEFKSAMNSLYSLVDATVESIPTDDEFNAMLDKFKASIDEMSEYLRDPANKINIEATTSVQDDKVFNLALDMDLALKNPATQQSDISNTESKPESESEPMTIKSAMTFSISNGAVTIEPIPESICIASDTLSGGSTSSTDIDTSYIDTAA